MTDTRPMRVTEVADDAFVALVRGAGKAVPIEQSPAWDRFDEAVDGRAPWGRLAFADQGADAPVAVISLSAYEGRGFRYLWARHGPVWLVEATPERERALRTALRAHLQSAARDVAFVRLHTEHRADGLEPMLQTMTYDRTVVIDLTVPQDEYLASLAKKFRYTIRQSLKHEDVTVTDESGMPRDAFDELYAVYRETAQRDGFGIFPADVYWSMIASLRPHVRVFVARRGDDARAIAWTIVTLMDGHAQYVYAAATAEARDTDSTVRLLWEALPLLREDGATSFDMMGVDSDLSPELAGVGRFKRKWGEPTFVAPSWDLPLRPVRYRLLVLALKLKRALRR